MEYMYGGNINKLKGKTVKRAFLHNHEDEFDSFTIPVIEFTDGSQVYCMSDDEGNGGGSLHMYGLENKPDPKMQCSQCGGTCGEQYFTIPLVPRKKFCNRDCAKAYNKENPRNIPCEQCGKICESMYRFKGAPRGARYCSSECCKAWREEHRTTV